MEARVRGSVRIAIGTMSVLRLTVLRHIASSAYQAAYCAARRASSSNCSRSDIGASMANMKTISKVAYEARRAAIGQGSSTHASRT